MKSPNFNLEGDKTRFPNANSLKIGSKFTWVGFEYEVVKFTKENIVAVCEDGTKKEFYDFTFETQVHNGDIKIK